MKNKKILNICLFIFALISLITFIVPLSKYEAELNKNIAVNIVFYFTNSLMLLCLTGIIIFSIVNLFKDKYGLVIGLELLSLICILCVFVNLVMFASIYNFKIGSGYILVAIEIFILANFSQMVRLLHYKNQLKNNKNKLANTNKKQEVKSDNKQLEHNNKKANQVLQH